MRPWPPYDRGVDFSFAFTPDLIAVFVTLFVLRVAAGAQRRRQERSQ